MPGSLTNWLVLNSHDVLNIIPRFLHRPFGLSTELGFWAGQMYLPLSGAYLWSDNSRRSGFY